METIFGGFWDFQADLAKADTAYTNIELLPHTDGTYSHDAPGLQLLHCLELDAVGGESTLVDAFAAMGGVEYAVALWRHGGFFQRGYLSLGARAVWLSATLGGGRTPFEVLVGLSDLSANELLNGLRKGWIEVAHCLVGGQACFLVVAALQRSGQLHQALFLQRVLMRDQCVEQLPLLWVLDG